MRNVWVQDHRSSNYKEFPDQTQELSVGLGEPRELSGSSQGWGSSWRSKADGANTALVKFLLFGCFKEQF